MSELFAKRLRELRVERKLSQVGLSRETGISSSAIARWELAQGEPTLSFVITLVKFFNVSMDYISGMRDY